MRADLTSPWSITETGKFVNVAGRTFLRDLFFINNGKTVITNGAEIASANCLITNYGSTRLFSPPGTNRPALVEVNQLKVLGGTFALDRNAILIARGGLIGQDGASIVAAGGGNIVAAGGGNIVAAGGGNIVAAGGGNIVAAGGGNLGPNGLPLISLAGSSIVAAGGGNLVSPGGGNIVAAGGGNRPIPADAIGHAGDDRQRCPDGACSSWQYFAGGGRHR